MFSNPSRRWPFGPCLARLLCIPAFTFSNVLEFPSSKMRKCPAFGPALSDFPDSQHFFNPPPPPPPSFPLHVTPLYPTTPHQLSVLYRLPGPDGDPLVTFATRSQGAQTNLSCVRVLFCFVSGIREDPGSQGSGIRECGYRSLG